MVWLFWVLWFCGEGIERVEDEKGGLYNVQRQVGGSVVWNVWNRIEIQGLDDADGQGFDWSGCRYLGLAQSDLMISFSRMLNTPTFFDS